MPPLGAIAENFALLSLTMPGLLKIMLPYLHLFVLADQILWTLIICYECEQLSLLHSGSRRKGYCEECANAEAEQNRAADERYWRDFDPQYDEFETTPEFAYPEF